MRIASALFAAESLAFCSCDGASQSVAGPGFAP